jgi:beta-glucosidase
VEGILEFPEGFVWGVATSAFQCEGAATSPHSSWTRWEALGHIRAGNRSGVACDWWANAERDLDLARDLGLRALRMSIEWSRIEPRPGRWDDDALERYREIAAGLRERGIEPMITLHHFTNPVWFEDSGAFTGGEAAELFTRFATHAVAALADVCSTWVTFNEPNVYTTEGYVTGHFPPGLRGRASLAARAQANIARAHARTYRRIHELQPDAKVGWAHHCVTFRPWRGERRLDRLVAALYDSSFNEPFPHVLQHGRMPRSLGGTLVGDLSEARGTCDFVGINLYALMRVAFDPRRPRDLFGRRVVPPDAIRADPTSDDLFGEPYPQGIADFVERLGELGKPIYVLENGYPDRADRVRPWVLATAARAMHDALRGGADLRGYYHWTLVDNFEWYSGWDLRFGLVELDERTQERTPRPSAQLYSRIATTNSFDERWLAELTPEAAPTAASPE